MSRAARVRVLPFLAFMLLIALRGALPPKGAWGIDPRWIQRPDFVAVDPTQVGLRAAVISTFMFVLVHPLWLAATLAGLAYAWLYIRSGQLCDSVIAHAVNNGALGIWEVYERQWQFW